MSCRGGVPSIVALFEEANRRAPQRSRASDGICASAKHTQQNPNSDHEPDQGGFAHAGDLTNDPESGIDCVELFRLLRERRDARIRYVIFKRQVYLGPWSDGVQHGKRQPWIVKPYTGPNPHDKHMHVSVGYDHSPETTTTPWFEEEDMTGEQAQQLEAIFKGLTVQGTTSPEETVNLMFDRIKKIEAALTVPGTTSAEDAFNLLFARVREIHQKVVEEP